jgi:hypothetical protein
MTGKMVQAGYAERVLRTFGMWDCNPVLTPMDPNVRLTKRDSPEVVDPRLHRRMRSIVGCLSYLVNMIWHLHILNSASSFNHPVAYARECVCPSCGIFSTASPDPFLPLTPSRIGSASLECGVTVLCKKKPCKTSEVQDATDFSPYSDKQYNNYINDINNGVYTNNSLTLVNFDLCQIYNSTFSKIY